MISIGAIDEKVDTICSTTMCGIRVLSNTCWKKAAVAITNMICPVDLAVAQKIPGKSASFN